MLFKAILAAAILAGPSQAMSMEPLAKCPEGQAICGDTCIPLDRTCCKLVASWGAAHAPCPVEWGCSSSGECRDPRLPAKAPVDRPVVPLCPSGMVSCASKCITTDEDCCGDGTSCAKGLVCAPPPMRCVEPPESTAANEEEEEPTPGPEPVSSRERTLQTPGDYELPTTAADFTLPAPEHTEGSTTEAKEEHTPSLAESSTKGECSTPRTAHESEADHEPDVESSGVAGPRTTSEEESADTTVVVTVTGNPTETETEAPEESRPADEGAGSRAEASPWNWVAPAVAALLFV